MDPCPTFDRCNVYRRGMITLVTVVATSVEGKRGCMVVAAHSVWLKALKSVKMWPQTAYIPYGFDRPRLRMITHVIGERGLIAHAYEPHRTYKRQVKNHD